MPDKIEDDHARTYISDGPVAINKRIHALDLLRGFALLGILVLNIDSFYGPSPMHDVPIGTPKPTFVDWHASLDFAIFTIKWLFFEGKMRTLFSILYGAGIVLLTQRFEEKGQPGRAADIFCRRNMWLLLFGLVHGMFIWDGDILTDYSIIALLFMFPLRHVAPKRLILAGLLIGILGGTVGMIGVTDAPETFAAEHARIEGRAAIAEHRSPSPEQRAALEAEANARAQEPANISKAVETGRLPYLQSIAPRTKSFLDFQLGEVFRNGWILEMTGSMLLGMGLFGIGFLSGSLPRRTYIVTALIGYAISMPVVLIGVSKVSADHFTVPSVTRWMFLPYSLEVFAGSIANASVILLLFKGGWLKGPFAALANVGRTAFSNYIFTSVLCQFLFGWGPWKLYGRIDYYQQIYIVAGVWAVNLMASALWLRVFAYGPLEWLWRSLTYWKRQPLRRQVR
jgi:uncharacterized protein